MAVDEHIKTLEAYFGDSIPHDKMISAVDELRDSKEIQRYFDTYIGLVRRYIKNAHEKRTLTGMAAEQLKAGKSYDKVAKVLAHDQMSYLLSKFGDPEVHKAWSAAVPSLYPKGRLKNMLETYLAAQD